MEARRLLRQLRDAGFQFRTDTDDLIVSPAGNLTPNLRRRIEAAKPSLSNLIQSRTADSTLIQCVDCNSLLPLSGVRCPACRDSCRNPTCASCGARVDGPDLSIGDLCQVERQSAETRTLRNAAPNRPG